jgi:NADH dehydrogenase (ubiquinone) 1 alpha subcomplex subunit 13
MSAPTQDLPPVEGFPKTIRYKRYLPKRGPSGLTIFTIGTIISAIGWYKVSLANEERREIRREKIWSRIHLIPLLQAETDRDLYRRLQHAKEREAEIMKDVPGWVPFDLKASVKGINADGNRDENASTPVYHTKRYVPPQIIFLPEQEAVKETLNWYDTPL